MRDSALREYGRRNRGLILFGPFFGRVGAVLLVAVGCWWAWVEVDRQVLASVVGGVGAVLALVYGLQVAAGGGLQDRMVRRVSGAGGPRHVVGAAGVCLLAAAVLMVWGAPW